jgi:anthranilate/para-aminobenzoate synthase component II
MKATFIDFEDSFTYNLVQELIAVGFIVDVILWKDFEENPPDGLLVLGPGPGHPDDYQKIFPLIKEWLNEKKPFFGVCLGHQIFWRILGEKVTRSLKPLHGQKVKLNFDSDWRVWFGKEEDVYVQRYNSLAVNEDSAKKWPKYKCFVQEGEILITRSSNVLTYQFHPESIGTSFQEQFLRPVWDIISQ